MYLLDTNVVSELRRPIPDDRVLQWIRDVPEERLFLSAVTIGEIQAGIENIRERDADKAENLTMWLDQVAAGYAVLTMDAAAFREWARIKHRKPDALLEDAMIGATALNHGLTVVSCNERDFRALNVPVLNPWQAG